jgi:hypothetical protein
MRKLLAFAASFVFSVAAAGQPTPVTINGTISDAGGNPATSGTVVFDIQPQSSSIHYYVPGVTTLAPQEVTCNIFTDGTLKNAGNTGPCVVWGNDVISPANTTYTVNFNPGNTNVNQVAQECIATPGPYNIDNPVFCPVVSIIPQYSQITAPVIQGNIIPNVNGVFTFGNSQAYYANIYTHTLTFQPSANGLLLATNGALSFTDNLPGGPYCPLTGCTFTGQIVLPGTGTGNDAATVNQVNAITGAFLPLTGGTLTGNLFGTGAEFINVTVTGQYKVNSSQIAASDLANGVSGTGAICLASGSSCAGNGTVTSVGLSSSNTTLLSVGGSPVTGSGTIALTLNVLGTDTKFVTGTTAGAANTSAVWDANGGIKAGPSPNFVVATFSGTSCTLVHFGDSEQNCSGSGTWSQSISGGYTMSCVMLVTPPGGSDSTGLTQSTLTISPTMSSTSFSYTISNIHDAAAGLTVGLSCDAFQ